MLNTTKGNTMIQKVNTPFLQLHAQAVLYPLKDGVFHAKRILPPNFESLTHFLEFPLDIYPGEVFLEKIKQRMNSLVRVVSEEKIKSLAVYPFTRPDIQWDTTIEKMLIDEFKNSRDVTVYICSQ